jgi:hypothetical protein
MVTKHPANASDLPEPGRSERGCAFWNMGWKIIVHRVILLWAWFVSEH